MNILLVDDDSASRTSVAKFLRELGHDIMESDNGEHAWELFSTDDFPMVLSDIKMPHMDGMELLQLIKASSKGPDTDVVLFTGHGTMESAIDALRSGAYDYLLKPVNVEELASLTDRIAEHQALRRENRILTRHFQEEVQAATEEVQKEVDRLKKLAARAVGLDGVGFFSEVMRGLVNQAHKYHTDRSIPVLIEGETGTGKEIISKIIHYGDIASTAPFVDINCAAITANLFDSELFGYEAGSSTRGLRREQQGKVDIAAGGTLFLDEVGEIPLELQGKLLRVIQEKEFYRVGGLRKIKADVRIVCATNSNLEQAVVKGAFRKDLYYRLKVGHIQIPPLRERLADIYPLALMLLQEFSCLRGKQFTSISEEAAGLLLSYTWPGNVRELRNAIEWAAFMYDDVVLKPQHLNIIKREQEGAGIDEPNVAAALETEVLRLPPKEFSLEKHIDHVVREALCMHHGNKTAAAQYLGISRRALCYRLDQMTEE